MIQPRSSPPSHLPTNNSCFSTGSNARRPHHLPPAVCSSCVQRTVPHSTQPPHPPPYPWPGMHCQYLVHYADSPEKQFKRNEEVTSRTCHCSIPHDHLPAPPYSACLLLWTATLVLTCTADSPQNSISTTHLFSPLLPASTGRLLQDLRLIFAFFFLLWGSS